MTYASIIKFTNEWVKSGVERDEEGPPSVRKEQKGIMAFEGHENRLETSFNTKPNPTTGRAHGVLQHQMHSEAPIRPIYSPSHVHEYNTSVRHLPDTSDSRQKVKWARRLFNPEHLSSLVYIGVR